jgi:outer membrane protein assembly factor BamD (BamD/ComL family)
MQAERVLLDRARRDLLSGEASAALEEVETHARLYRRGVLGEERDALRVEALVAMRRYEQAQTAGSRFRAAYPQSMLGPAVDGALGTIP